ncbi:unnamed protein product [Diatraea saccharalis]|uniref:WW domain-containing protein n=1 Tax=Diatraea saccharalis TaxID=40085 RepID=A0A9P0FZU4_9NEOP|nr:unnamed protein product [Diatraea saccharalis]
MSTSAVVCREVFDENSQPSAEEISEYAQQLGIDPESESHLLPLARDGLMQALPSPWKAYYDEKLQTHYYYNEETKKTQWEHPLDNVYRELVKRARDASMQDDTCASVQELLTFEENTKNLERVETKVESDDDDLATDSENRTDVKENVSGILTPSAKRPNSSGRSSLAPLSRLDKKLSDLRISPLRRSIDSSILSKPNLIRNTSDRDLLSRPTLERPKHLFKHQSEIIDLKMHILNSPEEENFSPLLSAAKVDKGLPLTGMGNMFLKLSKSDLPSPDTDKSHPLDSLTKSDPPKGILREKMSDIMQRKVDNVIGRQRQATSFEEDRKSVRFKLENLPEPTMSPGSNSSSEQNDGQSSIISATPAVSLPITPSPAILNPIASISLKPINANFNPVPSNLAMKPLSSIPISSNSVPSVPITHPSIVLSPLASRPPLPPRPASDSPREAKSASLSDKDSFESENRGVSPKRRLLKPPAGVYIKPDLFQKTFQKISDLVRPSDMEPTPMTLEEPNFEKEARPRSPMIPQKSKISINLMESIESETSIDSPDKEFANLDLNDLDDTSDIQKDDTNETINKTERQEKGSPKDVESHEISEKTSSHSKESTHYKSHLDSVSIPQIKVPNLDIISKQSKLVHSDSDDSKKSFNEESKTKSVSVEVHKVPQLKVSPTASYASDIRSPREFNKPWSPLSTFKPLNKAVVAPQIKSSDSASSLGKSLTSPRLDGVILSQGKSTDNVVVVYQFESNEDSNKIIKSPLIPDAGTRDMFDRSKGDERRRLELSLQKELEGMRMEWASKERRMRAELQDEIRDSEERFILEKRVRLTEQSERHKKEMEEALQASERNHAQALQKLEKEYEEKYHREAESLARQHEEKMKQLAEKYQSRLLDQQQQLEIENERALAELRDQLLAALNRERTRMMEENRANIETLREEHTTRITDLRHDYRAEVERLRTQHACHLEEIRARLASERAASGRHQDERALAEKYKCLKEKHARLKHDVKMSMERRNKRREMSMTTGSETEKSNSHKATQERCKELNERSSSVAGETEPCSGPVNNNTSVRYNDNEMSSNNNHNWNTTNNKIASTDTSLVSAAKQQRPHRRITAVAFREPLRRRRDRDRDTGKFTFDSACGATTDCQDSSDATTADEKPKAAVNGMGIIKPKMLSREDSGHGRRRCFTRLKSASTSRLNYSPKRGEGWSSPLECLRQQLRKLDDLEDQFPDLACQPSYSLRYPFGELGSVTTADAPELEFVRHRALVEREGIRRARAVLKKRRAALRESRASLSPHRAPSEATTSDASSGSEVAAEAEAGGAVLRSLRALHADVRDIWRALDARRPHTG